MFHISSEVNVMIRGIKSEMSETNFDIVEIRRKVHSDERVTIIYQWKMKLGKAYNNETEDNDENFNFVQF